MQPPFSSKGLMANKVDSIVKALLKMVEKLEAHHEDRLNEIGKINMRVGELVAESHEHETEAQRAKTIAENLKKVLGD